MATLTYEGGTYSENVDSLTEYLMKSEQKWFNEEENKMKRMSKKEIDILLEDKDNLVMDVEILKFTKRGFVIRINLDNETKREFVEYGENLGSMINELIKEFVEEKREEKIKQNEIEYHQEELQKLKEDK